MRSFFRDAQRLLDDDQAEDAVQKLSEGLKTFPEDALIAGLLGWAHYKAGDLDSAHKYGRKAVDLEVRSDWSVAVPFAFYNLGLCSLLLGRFERSMTWYEMSVDRYKGLVLDESIEDLEEVLSADRPEAWFALGFLREHKEDVPRAIAAYEQFLDSDSPYDKYKQLAQEAIQRLQRSDGEGDKRS